MALPPDEAPDARVHASARRVYHLSLAIVIVGLILIAVVVAFSWWASSTGNFPTYASGLTLDLTGTGGFMLCILGGTVAVHHRSYLRENWPND
jgi:hypothetical protein